MSYQKTTGPLMANSHPGSYCGQDAYNDMFVTAMAAQRERERVGVFVGVAMGVFLTALLIASKDD